VIGPIFTREAMIAPRRAWFFTARTMFVAALFGLAVTSWQLLVGSQRIENLGDLAWFGAAAFEILAPLQLAVALPFSALLVASAVALEKDRKTLDLLLMTRLTNVELVLGKLFAALLTVLVVIVAAMPLMMIISLLGGIATEQIVRVQAVTLAGALVAGSLGSTVALWREKTFQALAMTVLIMALWLGAWEIAAAELAGTTWLGVPMPTWAVAMSPWQAIQQAAAPRFVASTDGWMSDPVSWFLVASGGLTFILNLVAAVMVRVWNPPREVQPRSDEERAEAAARGAGTRRLSVHSAGGKARRVWDNPILWREIRTWAYGKKIVVIHLAYWAVFLVCAAAILWLAPPAGGSSMGEAIPRSAKPLAALFVVSLILLNALAVTSLTSERDSRALDLLLVTDLSPKELVFGKLGGAIYNAKEMIALPITLCVYLWFVDRLSTENLVFLLGGLLVMNVFVAVLGLHAGMTYANSRTAIATSIGTLLFLFLGIATCMWIMLLFSDSFQRQLAPFLAFIVGGGIGLYAVLGWRNPSAAIACASGLAPFVTFYVITSFLRGDYGLAFVAATTVYGFATWAMLLPAISEFDVATGRTTAREE
jgi:ABC-type transport system involved in multi-copper enzyme maturation permease subunit